MPIESVIAKRASRAQRGVIAPRRSLRSGSAALRAITAPAVQPTSLKLPAALKAQIDDAAIRDGVSAHAFMLHTLTDAVERAQLRAQFQQDAADALRNLRASGMGHKLSTVRDYFAKLALFRQGKGPRPRRPAMTKVI